MGSEGGPSGTAAFAQALAALKRRGSNILLVGPAYEDAHLPASRRLLGSETATTKRSRLLVFAGRDASVEDRLLEPDDDHLHTVVYESLTRGAVAAQPVGDAGPSIGSETTDERLAALGNEMSRVIETVESEAGSLDPAELRVCVDSLVPLVENHGEQQVFRLLHALTGEMRRTKAMGHYHLPVEADCEVVRTLTPLFEAVVELRVGPDGPEQRWTLTEDAVTTEWLPI